LFQSHSTQNKINPKIAVEKPFVLPFCLQKLPILFQVVLLGMAYAILFTERNNN
jgi:hypothetical protein